MADIFPTGFFGARNAFANIPVEQRSDSTVVLIGCGPVGLCALVNALDYKPKHLLAVDSIPERLELAKKLGAEPWNFKENREGLDKRVKELTDGRGADAVIEVVGLSPALQMGFELLRPWGSISSIGVHNGEVKYQGYEQSASIDTKKTDSLDGQSSVRQELENPDGTMSCAISVPRGPRGAEEEAPSLGVCFFANPDCMSAAHRTIQLHVGQDHATVAGRRRSVANMVHIRENVKLTKRRCRLRHFPQRKGIQSCV